MSEQAVLVAQPRETSGSSHARRLRQQGQVPGIMYAEGAEATPIQISEHLFEKELRLHASEHVMIDIEIMGQSRRKVLVKDVQRHPLTRKILHVDLQAVSMTHTLKISIPIELEGEPVGVSQFGGVLEQLLREADVECLPTDIPASLVFDVSGLSVGEGITLDAAGLDPSKVTLITDRNIAVAHVSAPRVVQVDEMAEGEPGSGQPEVITEKKDNEA